MTVLKSVIHQLVKAGNLNIPGEPIIGPFGLIRGGIQWRADSATPVVDPLMSYDRLPFSCMSGNQMSRDLIPPLCSALIII